MTGIEKNKFKSRFTILMFGVFGLFIAWMSDASAQFDYFVDRGCTTCHDGGSGPAVVVTCNGCHAHGTHSSSVKSDINITATTDNSTYNVGDTISITVNGGYKSDWVRVNVYDDTGTLVAQSKGACDATISSVMACAEGDSLPVTLTAIASSTGTQMWTASWYGNINDGAGSVGGISSPQSISTGVTNTGWLEDLNNAEHGEEIVAIAAFTVNDANTGAGGSTGGSTNTGTTAASSDGGGGSLSWPLIVMILIALAAMLIRDCRIGQESVNVKE